MPRYFFDIEDGHVVRDNDGRELANLEAAKAEANRALSDAVKDDFTRDALREACINIRDESGVVVMRVCLAYSATPPLP
ncbi:DUF6894 family protein [Devosia nitrariae]|uniref:DUF6894 domain-containing protein n=1 Tax=Devosia nitrariae TaxID=2071872 RepID=A0ABQ5W5K7_9HYPH|nr:hypothetical protein [Devosia nitrariae]GLQ55367.1 hypothetical protein GCM10010862_26260 [Devosia nitrariae]